MSVKLPHVAVLLLLVVFWVVLVAGFTTTLFESPALHLTNVGAARVHSISLLGVTMPVNLTLPGASVDVMIKQDMFHVYFNLDLLLPIGLGEEHVAMKYNLDDIPCKEYSSNYKVGQVFSLLAIFSCLFTILFAVGVMFTHVMRPFLWLTAWTTAIFTSVATSVLLKTLCDGFCLDNPSQRIPEAVSFAVPSGGFALYIMASLAFGSIAVITACA
ncbi:hypothetical protein DQ04_08921000 [Trypanosoma grayi]|uniref:hypothetical protein n=1 Tax=Trypanosoma grayi TaxID=71804 RepID=UPI0004F4882B|nr:hypothetical protein DQ04_08921000 [Trypanosoma grayi]KEG07743.1 hypothetical protein DQ04_08921000 [Trypanosoma grayi]